MGDDITIGVTEIVNNIEVTAQPNDQIVDISVVDNTDEVTLNITPTVIEINVNKGSSYAKWGTILGTLSDQEDLQDALDLKADLVDGKVPSSQLPSYVDDVIEVANYAALPATGETGKIYITLDTNHIYRWSGSTYVEITDNTAVWGAITGTLSSQTDLQNALNLKANDNAVVHLTGDESISGTKTFSSILKSGLLFINETGGFGNISGFTQLGGTADYFQVINGTNTKSTKFIHNGGRNLTMPATDGTLALDENVVHLTGAETITGTKSFNSTTGIGIRNNVSGSGYGIYSDNSSTGIGFYVANSGQGKGFSVANVLGSFGNFYEGSYNGTLNYAVNYLGEITASKFVKQGGTSSQFLKADGSVDSNSYQPLLTNPITGSLTTNYLPKATGANFLDDSLLYDNGTNVGIGTTSPSYKFNVIGANPTDAGIVSNRLIGLRKENNTLAGYLALLGGDNGDNAKIIGYNSAGTQTFEINASTSATYFNSGNVGIGTTSPTHLLSVENSSSYETASFKSSSVPYQIIGNAAVGDYWRGFFTGQNIVTNATTGKPSVKVSGYTASAIAYSSDSSQGYLGFFTTSSTTANTDLSERMRITSGGNVGIGTTSPNQLLHIEKDQNTYTNLRVRNNDAGSSAYTMIGLNSSGNSWGMRMGSSAANSNRLDFVIDAFGSPVERMSITSGGNVGIGTTSPSYQLQLSTDSAAKPTSALWTIASDERIKENINSYTKGLNELLKINPITYDYNGLGGFKKGKGGVGIIAQEIAEILPDSVSSIKGKLNETDEEEIDILNFNGHELTYILINAVKEQNEVLKQLKAEIEILKNK